MTRATPQLQALVFRFKTGCRQYAFPNAEELETWAARHPYNKETLRVQVYTEAGKVADQWTPAKKAADFVRETLRSNP